VKHCLLGAALLTSTLAAFVASDGADTVPAPGPDAQDVLLLTSTRPILLRLHVHLDGKPFTAAWERYLDKLFADLDRDGDGFLSKAEAARAPTSEFLQSFLQGSLNLEAAAEKIPFEKVDNDGDGRVSRREFAAYYRRCGFDRSRVVLLPDRGDAAALTDALFHVLDTDRDGKLSLDELKASSATLRRVDLNEDEWITPDELLPHRPSRPAAEKSRLPTLVDAGFLPLEAGGALDALVRSVQARYQGKEKLDAGAIGALLVRPPELELIVRLGTLGKGEARVEVFNPTARPMPLAKEARLTKAGDLLLDIGGLSLEVEPGALEGSVRGLHAFYRQQFEEAGEDKRGFLERKQVADVPTLAALFGLADRDGDGKLTDKELDAFLDLHLAGSAGFFSAAVTDRSLGLFDLLDEDGDGRLSLRELHTAWDRLRRFDRSGAGKLARDEFPRRLQVRVAPGKAVPQPAAKARPAREPVKLRGPGWFRKMDRNGDGYVSRREWLGSEELFNKLDVDGDGLISPEEAERLRR
jgi:Ca2+-binding EF-hand superfamily protein